jgi:hypothetical protein
VNGVEGEKGAVGRALKSKEVDASVSVEAERLEESSAIERRQATHDTADRARALSGVEREVGSTTLRVVGRKPRTVIGGAGGSARSTTIGRG